MPLPHIQIERMNTDTRFHLNANTCSPSKPVKQSELQNERIGAEAIRSWAAYSSWDFQGAHTFS